MAKFEHRIRMNTPGKFYVDQTCTDCAACRQTAPNMFKRDDYDGWTYVETQPRTPAEVQLAIDALEGCPTESIGDDGDENDWWSPILPLS